jgi:hypothetical protein
MKDTVPSIFYYKYSIDCLYLPTIVDGMFRSKDNEISILDI